MKVEIKTNDVKTFPCIMKNRYNQIVLATVFDEDKYITVLTNEDGSYADVGKTYKSDIKDTDYSPLPKGYQITITN